MKEHHPISTENETLPSILKLGYKFPKKLGEGGKGEVFKIYDPKQAKNIVIKIQNMKTSKEEIKKEFRFAKLLKHPSIIEVYEFGELPDKRGYYTMEYIDGKNFFWDGKRFEDLIELIILICQALFYVHSKGIVHCDIKPSNVLIKNKQIKLMDFGLAHYDILKDTTFKGTIEYMAPEVIMGKNIDRRADIYSLGIMLYEVIANRLPFEGDTPISILQKHITTQPGSLSKYRKDIPENLDKIILKMIAKFPENRFQGTDEILKELGWKGKFSLSIDEKRLILKSSFVGRKKEKQILNTILENMQRNGKIVGITGTLGIGKTHLLEEIRSLSVQKGIQIIEKNTLVVNKEYNNSLIIIDDFELVNENIKKFIQHLAKRIKNTKNILLLASKDKKYLPPFTQEIIPLKGLSQEETKKMISSMLGGAQLSNKFIKWVYKNTGGIPGIILNYISYLVGKVIRFKEGTWKILEQKIDSTLIPDNFYSVLPTLSSSEEKILKTASIFPDTFTLSMLEVLIPEDEILSTIETFCNIGILQKIQDKYSFSSSLQRKVLYQKLKPDERKRLHTKIGKFMENKKDIDKFQLAYHFARSSIKKKGIKYSLKAARYAKKMLLNERALTHYNDAIQLMNKKEKKDILEEYGDTLYTVSKYEEARSVYNSLLNYTLSPQEKSVIYRKIGNIYEKLGEIDKAFEIYKKGMKEDENSSILRSIGWLYLKKGNYKTALTLSTKALNLATKEKAEEEISKIYHNIGSIYLQTNKLREAISNLEKSIKFEHKIKDYIGLAGTYNNIGIAYQKIGDTEKSLEYYKKSLALREKMGDVKGMAVVYRNIGNLYYIKGDINDAENYYLKCLEIQEDLNDSYGMATSYNTLGLLFLKKGMLDIAINRFYECIEIRKKLQDSLGLASSYNNIGIAYIIKEDWELAEKFIKKSLKLKKELSNVWNIPSSLINLAIIYMNNNNFKEANKCLEEAKIIAEDSNNIQALSEIYCQIGELNLLEKKEEIALLNLHKALSLLKKSPNKKIEGIVYRNLAKAGEEEKEELLKRSIEIFKDIREEREMVLSMLEMGKVLKEKNKREEAEEMLKKAIDLGERLGMKKSVEESKELIEELKAQELNTIYRITEIMNSVLNLDELLNKIMDSAIELLRAERGLLILIEDGNIVPRVVRDLEEEVITDATSISKSIIRDVAYKGEPIIATNAESDKRLQERKSIKNYEIKSVICVPLRLKDKIVGTIYLDNRKVQNIFTEKQKDFLLAFANLAAIAIENGRLHQQLKEEKLYLQREVEEKYYFENIIGISDKMQEVYKMIKKVSASDVTVLIQGETGTGKELVARAIHYTSDRRDKKFVPVDCASIPRELLESELFGHKKGAFTGALRDKKGLFEVADGGTIFLDEIAELPLELQAKLLRVIQEKEIRRLGEVKTYKIDVRIITATNKDLKQEVGRKNFREDLYWRLNVVTINLPPLRERKEDIPLLANHFFNLYTKKFGKKLKGLHKDAIEILMREDWPGNVRELEHRIEQAVATTDENNPITQEQVSTIPISAKSPKPTSLKDIIEETEKRLILGALKKYNYNKTKAAKSLGLSRFGLIKKLNRYKIANNVDT